MKLIHTNDFSLPDSYHPVRNAGRFTKYINSNDPYIWIQRAEALRKLGKVKEAQESEQKAKKLETSLN